MQKKNIKLNLKKIYQLLKKKFVINGTSVVGYFLIGHDKKEQFLWICAVTLDPGYKRHFYKFEGVTLQRCLDEFDEVREHFKYKFSKGIHLNCEGLFQEKKVEPTIIIQNYRKSYKKGQSKQHGLCQLQALHDPQQNTIIIQERLPKQDQELKYKPFNENQNEELSLEKLIQRAEYILKFCFIDEKNMEIRFYDQNQQKWIQKLQAILKKENIVKQHTFQLGTFLNEERIIVKGRAQLVKQGFKWALKLYTFDKMDDSKSIFLTDKIVLNKINKEDKQNFIKNFTFLVQNNTIIYQEQNNWKIQFIDHDFFKNKVQVKILKDVNIFQDLVQSHLKKLSQN
ncbi:hypothetical protein PPERSA_07420 [Pseudocohnilembus persalinus]|uniref:Uncharacterized protein n=1 Tax=Pseudocohnilembus persalinus TaxID=266149 RepID=A0A0V0QAB5_PSEPJ|nr:hypothetical protein PPERSA_07420 [Pseudocohnilembus persalinus]|eukprot:KRW99177.1 hypothetical protein PPERSA_07420 [Pseudocohnilembus persalinus]